MKVSYDWLKDYLAEPAPTPKELEELLTFHAFEIEEVVEEGDDTVIDVDVLPNRSSDCLSHRGIAREIATLTDTPLKLDPFSKKPALPVCDSIDVTIEDAEACPRFTASVITDITVGPSPLWLQKRLKAIGQRPINNIVDATNYVMYATGQPIHAYDATKFPQVNGKWNFVVRKAKEGEVVSLLAEGGKDEDRDVTLKGTELLIVDGSSNTPIGLAGVKGGRFAGVDSKTTSIIVEAAHFHPTLTRQTARRLGIIIDASKRFENEPSRELPLYAQKEITELIVKIAGGECRGLHDTYLEKQSKVEVTVRASRVNEHLGLALDAKEMIDIVERLGAKVTPSAEGFVAVSPFERTDLNIEEDYIEEIGRIHGLDKIKAVLPEKVPVVEMNARQYYTERVRRTLLPLGFSEVITSSFRKKDEIQLRNALATDKSYVRSSLVKNIDEALTLNTSNLDLLGIVRAQVFEIGTVFHKTKTGIGERVALAIGVRGKRTGYTPKDDALLGEAMKAVNEALGVQLTWSIEKGLAEAMLSEIIEKLPVPEAYEKVSDAPAIQYQAFSSYPAVARDIALWVGEGTTPGDVEKVLNENAGDLRVRTTLFDEFTKDGKTSFAFRLVFQSPTRTLTDEEVNKDMEKINAAVAALKWEVR